MDPRIIASTKDNNLLDFPAGYVPPVRAAFVNRFKREQQIHLKSLKNNVRRQNARIAIDKYINDKDRWMARNITYLRRPVESYSMNPTIIRDSFNSFFAFLSKWKLSDVTADINRMCQIARLPSASFYNIPMSFEAIVGSFFLEKFPTEDLENGVETAFKLIRVKSKELGFPVETPDIDIVGAKTELRKIVEKTHNYYELRSEINDFSSRTIGPELQKFDDALAAKIKEIEK